MLTPDLVGTLLEPIAGDAPSGPDLEYDPAFLALAVAAEGKPEQQFGETIIAAVEPDWADVAAQAQALLERSRDLRPAVLLLRAATRMQGLAGTRLGLELLTGLLERFWDSVHPQLDADDDNDPTMRLNALAALNDDSALVRDLYEARLGIAAGIGPIRVRDLAIARGLLTPADDASPLSAAAVQGGLDDILASVPETADAMRGLGRMLDRLSELVAEHSARGEGLDLGRLKGITHLLAQAAPGATEAAPQDADGAAPEAAVAPAGARAAVPGEIRTRQDALLALDRVIHYLEQSEPGNPAPLLIARAKQLIGVSFLDIMANLAPNALETIEVITGPRPES
ncbi:MAG TPA: type VI secretion system ImpA family N-terminal domain-containing protein [Ottowia sp.]|uniref:type VI secretion system protein TssA n=1 Tax=Ottowia sp. TaxID=1898956 RepID=UPI002D0011D7|nr:type VI secretion system ImpA family N-terminal domain-containing protein [Ottowia sp.]HMN20148.1 type VI secretion system ImpA family N-terminal domain-containing protein [Ottowia sp.]